MAGKSKKRRKTVYSLIFMTVLAIATVAFAKYVKEITAIAPVADTVADYYMDVVADDDSQIKLSQKLDVNEINPGQFQAISFIVRNGNDKTNIISDVDLEYTIKIKYTQNLPLTYDLYEYKGLDGDNNPIYELLTDYEEESDDDDNPYHNVGKSQVYKVDDNGDRLLLKTKKSEMVMQKFKLVITWENDTQMQIDNKYVNEVDLSYLLVEAVQKES